MPTTLAHPVQHLLDLAVQRSGRLLIGLVGIPGSGKSTLAKQLQTDVAQHRPDLHMQVIGMDGFHLSKSKLTQFPDPERAFARRGAPWTFDAAGFVHKVRAIKAHQASVLWPEFEHAVGDPVEDAVEVTQDSRVVLIEGLYLLHRADTWAGLEGLFDEIWFLDTPPALARERLLARHQQAWGISREQAAARIDASDSKNASLVSKTRTLADWLV